MRKEKFSFLMFLLVFAGTLSFSSCQNDVEHVDVKFLMTWEASIFASGGQDDMPLLSNGEILNITSYQIDKDNSSDGVRIKSVDYYFDGEKISSTSTYPYSLKYLIQNQAIGHHVLTVKPSIKSSEDTDFSFSFNYAVEVLASPARIEIPLCLGEDKLYEDEDSIITVSKDEEFYGSVPSINSNLGASITKVEYYWDDVLFGASNVSPYRFSYGISSEKTGEHVLKYITNITTDYGLYNVTMRKKIIIQ